jgi:membrane-bound serine protease (ClpP class)
MEFLINPNVSYVLLVLGFIIAILALFSPGTGIIETVALFALVLAGYGIINLPVNTWALAILAVSMIPFAVALRKTQKHRFLILGSAVLAFLIGSALLFQWDGWRPGVNLVLILLLSSLTLGFAWLVASKSVEAMTARPAFNLDRLVGMKGQVSSDIRGEGTVYVNGEEWSARSDTFIPAGSTVRVLRREGLMLEVEVVVP